MYTRFVCKYFLYYYFKLYFSFLLLFFVVGFLKVTFIYCVQRHEFCAHAYIYTEVHLNFSGISCTFRVNFFFMILVISKVCECVFITYFIKFIHFSYVVLEQMFAINDENKLLGLNTSKIVSNWHRT